MTPDPVREALAEVMAAFDCGDGVRLAKALPAARTALSHPPAAAEPVKCPICNGNDLDMPCAYPTERLAECPRTKRLARVQACRAEDRVMLATPAGAELVAAATQALTTPSPQPTQQAAPAVQPFTQEDLRRLVCEVLEHVKPMLDTETLDALITKALGAKEKPE